MKKIDHEGLMAIVLLLLVIVLAVLVEIKHQQESKKAQKWEEFEKCIESFPSDGVCDSCYRAIIMIK